MTKDQWGAVAREVLAKRGIRDEWFVGDLIASDLPEDTLEALDAVLAKLKERVKRA